MRGSRIDPDARKGDIGDLWPIFRYIRPYKLIAAGVLIALVTASAAVLSMGHGLKYLIDTGFHSADDTLLNRSLFYLMVIVVVLAVATFCRFYLVTRLGERVIADIRKDILQHLIAMEPAFFETNRTGAVISRITADTTILQTVIGSSLSIAMRNTLLLIGGLSLLVFTSPSLAGTIAIMIPVIILPVLFLGKKVRRLSRDSQDKVADLSASLEEVLFHIKTIQAYNREEREYKRFTEKVEYAFQSALKRVTVRAILTALVILLAFGSIGFVLWMGGHAVNDGSMTPGQLSSFVFYSAIVASAFGAISQVIGDLQRAAGAAESLMELLALKPAITDPATPAPLDAAVTEDAGASVQFEDVSFRYETRDNNVLEHIDLTIQPGETVALVGPSGAGKSTLIQLLLRFYDPHHGDIVLDNTNIRDMSLNALRDQFAYVSQDPIIFSTTARENIAFAKDGATEEEVIAAAKAARCWEFISKLPEGLDTYLGEKGVRLSGGEKQRIAIARAVLKNPRILLLDEATSALDAENERLVQEALETLMRGRTTLVIAHRLATVQHADRIVVLNEGKVEATGNHEALLKSSPLYHHLASLQFSEG